MRPRTAITLVLAALLAGGVAMLRLAVGGSGLGLPEDPAIWDIRGIRVVMGLVVGGALGAGGVALQSLLRNPLASPDLLGLSAGASLAVTLAGYLAYVATGSVGEGGWSTESWALVGALGTLGIVYALSQRRGVLDPVGMILVGVVVGIVASAWTVFVQQLLPDRGFTTGRWLLGRLDDDASWVRVGVIGGATVAGVGVLSWLGGWMDAASMDEDEARSVGVPLGRLRAVQFGVTGALTAGAVTLAGPIGFVGLICPHLARLLGGPGHRMLTINAALLGGALVVGADTLVRAVDLGAGRMPIGVLTAIVGGPVFIALLWRERRR